MGTFDEETAIRELLLAGRLDEIIGRCSLEWEKPIYKDTEGFLNNIFKNEYPDNTDFDQVHLKVHILNELYSAGVKFIDEKPLARHIAEIGDVDQRLRAGDLNVVPEMAVLPASQRKHPDLGDATYYVFATKYCSFCQPNDYPIMDSFVRRTIRIISKEQGWDSLTLTELSDMGNYGEFAKALRRFIDYANKELIKDESNRLGSYKEVDQLLWMHYRLWKDEHGR